MDRDRARQEKQRIRERIWKLVESEAVGRFPGIRGRIPNFVGAERAAENLDGLGAWRKARRIKVNPDSPQAPARKRALEAGKVVYMAVPRLRDEACFIELDPERIDDLKKASSIKGAFALGRAVRVEEMPEIDLVLCGSVAVTRGGMRLGKGGGFSDLELALLVQAGRLRTGTRIVSTVHPVQIVDALPALEHDFRVDFVVTPERAIHCGSSGKRPRGIYWELLDREKLAEIPALRKLQVEKPATRNAAAARRADSKP